MRAQPVFLQQTIGWSARYRSVFRFLKTDISQELDLSASGQGYHKEKRPMAAFLYLYCITQKMPCFFHKIMLKFRLRKYEKNQIFSNENSGFLERKESQIYVFIRLCMG